MQAVDKRKNAKKNYLAPQNFECKCVFNNEFNRHTYCRI